MLAHQLRVFRNAGVKSFIVSNELYDRIVDAQGVRVEATLPSAIPVPEGAEVQIASSREERRGNRLTNRREVVLKEPEYQPYVDTAHDSYWLFEKNVLSAQIIEALDSSALTATVKFSNMAEWMKVDELQAEVSKVVGVARRVEREVAADLEETFELKFFSKEELKGLPEYVGRVSGRDIIVRNSLSRLATQRFAYEMNDREREYEDRPWTQVFSSRRKLFSSQNSLLYREDHAFWRVVRGEDTPNGSVEYKETDDRYWLQKGIGWIMSDEQFPVRDLFINYVFYGPSADLQKRVVLSIDSFIRRTPSTYVEWSGLWWPRFMSKDTMEQAVSLNTKFSELALHDQCTRETVKDIEEEEYHRFRDSNRTTLKLVTTRDAVSDREGGVNRSNFPFGLQVLVLSTDEVLADELACDQPGKISSLLKFLGPAKTEIIGTIKRYPPIAAFVVSDAVTNEDGLDDLEAEEQRACQYLKDNLGVTHVFPIRAHQKPARDAKEKYLSNRAIHDKMWEVNGDITLAALESLLACTAEHEMHSWFFKKGSPPSRRSSAP